VIQDAEREPALEVIRSYLESHGIIPAGRFGSWGYTSMEDSFMDGRAAVAKALRLPASRAA
jgi:hypothetical protein